jgi:large subunit ribosomal protein L17
MRHGNKINHLGRTTAHRKALLMNMANSLILKKRINTTLAKAKELKKFVEPIITKSKNDSTASRRFAFSKLQDKNAVSMLFRDVAVKIADRPGGYTRILKTGFRLGDNAEMCMIELVDFNETMLAAKTTGTAKKTKTTRRSSRSKKAAAPAAEAKVEAPEVKADTTETKPEENKE